VVELLAALGADQELPPFGEVAFERHTNHRSFGVTVVDALGYVLTADDTFAPPLGVFASGNGFVGIVRFLIASVATKDAGRSEIELIFSYAHLCHRSTSILLAPGVGIEPTESALTVQPMYQHMNPGMKEMDFWPISAADENIGGLPTTRRASAVAGYRWSR
jgi:hypothetical protein